MKLEVVIMAAGKGTRMKSRLPRCCRNWRANRCWPTCWTWCRACRPHRVVTLTGHGADQVEEALAGRLPQQVFARQEPRWAPAMP